uniref:Uncharacterized protein n=1 Tax=Petromyzon marinus TaxID=7757 RepID=S4R8R8_PETMA
QEKHQKELEELRTAGHEALAIIVEEYKALSVSAVQEANEAGERHVRSALETQVQACQELMSAQHERLRALLEECRLACEERIAEALQEQTAQHKAEVEKCLAEEVQKNAEALKAAVEV